MNNEQLPYFPIARGQPAEHYPLNTVVFCIKYRNDDDENRVSINLCEVIVYSVIQRNGSLTHGSFAYWYHLRDLTQVQDVTEKVVEIYEGLKQILQNQAISLGEVAGGNKSLVDIIRETTLYCADTWVRENGGYLEDKRDLVYRTFPRRTLRRIRKDFRKKHKHDKDDLLVVYCYGAIVDSVVKDLKIVEYNPVTRLDTKQEYDIIVMGSSSLLLLLSNKMEDFLGNVD